MIKLNSLANIYIIHPHSPKEFGTMPLFSNTNENLSKCVKGLDCDNKIVVTSEEVYLKKIRQFVEAHKTDCGKPEFKIYKSTYHRPF